MTFSTHRHLAFDKDQEVEIKFIYNEIFVQEDYQIQLESEQPVIVDCGANIGFASLYFSEKYPNAKIIAFEPNPSSVMYFNKNTQGLQESGNLKLYQVALGEENSLSHFYTTKHAASAMGSLVFAFKGHKIPVQVKKLSEYLTVYNRIDLVKIDIEGSEWEVTRDLISSGTIKKIDQILVEYHQESNTPNRLAEFIKLYEHAGFDVTIRRTIDVKIFVCSVLHCKRKN
ncbi:MAG TPA: hypothetical protein DCE78_01855 [Bacteroidetes bacterium]|nr:hypothetical protein [Bacteroidota bacterium]